MSKKRTKKVFSIKYGYKEAEIPQPTIWERIKDAVCFIGALLALIGFGILILAAISTTKL